jgi:hypothetical protein
VNDELRILVEPTGLVITPDSYHTRERDREIADRIMAELGYNPDHVLEIRVSETAVEVDMIDRSSSPPIRTARHGVARN